MMAVIKDSRMSQVSLKLLATIDDGEWHEQEDVIDRVMYTIPPGEAFRHGKQVSRRTTVDRRSMDEIIASGQRAKTVTTLNSLIQNGRVERNTGDRGAVKMVRIKRQIPYVYVVRDAEGNLSVETYAAQDVAIHVIDEQESSSDPDTDAKLLEEVLTSLPPRMTNKDRIETVTRRLMNRHRVQSVMAPYATEPKEELTTTQEGMTHE